MKIYIVQNVRPDLQAFETFEKAKEFAFEKANKRRVTNVWDMRYNTYEKSCLNPEICGESHIKIIERELK